jgi:hypothetical protein
MLRLWLKKQQKISKSLKLTECARTKTLLNRFRKKERKA